MELSFSPISITLALLFLSLKLIHHKLGKSRAISGSKLPPGPWKLPIIGSLHHLIGSLPHRTLRDLSKKHGEMMHLQLGELSVIVVSGPRMAKEVMKTNDLALANRPKLLVAEILTYNKDVAYSSYGGYWRQMRKICVVELLSSKRVRSYASIREDEAWRMVRDIQIQASSSSSPVNLTDKVYAVANDVTCRAAVGSRCKSQEELIRSMNMAMEMASGFDVADVFPSKKYLHFLSGTPSKLRKIAGKLHSILREVIQEHRDKHRMKTDPGSGCEDDDLVDVMLKINENGDLDFPLTTENITAIIVDMFVAGTDTSSATIIWAMSEMIRNPRIMAIAQAEVRALLNGKSRIETGDLKGLSYLKQMIKETLRLHPPIPLLVPRECREECEIGGYKIPIGTKVITNAWAVNRDPEFWENAESFEPERFSDSGIEIIGPNYEYVPFGGGRRMCPGIAFSHAITELVLAQLLYHFDWRIPGGLEPESLDMTEVFGASVKRKKGLFLAATVRYPFE